MADKRFEGRIGEVVALTAHDLDLRMKGTLGALTFRRKDVVALTGRMVKNAAELTVGATAKVVSGNVRYVGRVGRVVGNDGRTVSLKLKGTLGVSDFPIKDVEALE